MPFPGSTFYLAGGGGTGVTSYILAIAPLGLGSPVPIGNLLTLNVFGNFFHLLEFGFTDAAGCLVKDVPLPASVPSGLHFYCQFFTLNGTSQTCASSKGLDVTTQ